MEYEVIWLEPALLDLNGQVEYRAQHTSLEDGLEFSEEVFTFSERLRRSPHRGRRLPFLGENYFDILFAKKYRLVYQILSETVHILAFVHTSQDFPEAWRARPRGQ